MTPLKTACRVGKVVLFFTLTVAQLEAQQSNEMILAWNGDSELGYLRVELWTPEDANKRACRLVIKCAALTGVRTHTVQMVAIPPDIRTDPKLNRILVATPDDAEKNERYGMLVIGAVSFDGSLLLYAIGRLDLATRPILKPI